MNAHVQEIANDAGAVEALRGELRREDSLRLVEDREWTDAFLAGERRILEMIAKGESLVPILDAMCRLVEEMSSGSLATILLLDADGKRLRHAAAPSLPASYTEGMGAIAVGPSVGSCGTAAYRREPVIATDIATDPLWTDYRALPLAHGLRASWSTPILSSEGRVLGTFAILSREPRSPAPLHHHIIAQITHLAAVAIERERTGSALRQSEERFRRMSGELRRSEAYLTEAQRLSRTGSFGWNVCQRGAGLVGGDYCILGYDRAQAPELEMVLRRVHPEDLALVRQMMDAASREATSLDFEHRLLMPDGSVKHLHVLAHPARNGLGDVEFVGAVMDVTERKRAEALVTGEKRLLETIARGVALEPILEALCRFGEEMSGNALVSILLVSSDGKSLRHGAAPSLPQSYTAAIDGGLIGPCAGSCGTAAYRREPVFVSDITTDPLWDQHRHLALQHGLRACWSTPIFSAAHEVMGTFALYSRKSGVPTLEQRNLIEQMTHLAAVAIERERAEEALRASAQLARGQAEALTRTLDALARESAPDRLVEHVLRTITEQLDAYEQQCVAEGRRQQSAGFRIRL